MVEPQRATRRPRTQVGHISRKDSKQASEARSILSRSPGELTLRLFLRTGAMNRVERKAREERSANFINSEQ